MNYDFTTTYSVGIYRNDVVILAGDGAVSGRAVIDMERGRIDTHGRSGVTIECNRFNGPHGDFATAAQNAAEALVSEWIDDTTIRDGVADAVRACLEDAWRSMANETVAA